jgi:hypothetical protein
MKKELCVKLVICKDYTEMHGQQNMKLVFHLEDRGRPPKHAGEKIMCLLTICFVCAIRCF